MKDGYFHPTCHGWLPTRLVLEERKGRDVIGEEELVTAQDDGEVVLAYEEGTARRGPRLKAYRLHQFHS